MFPVFGGAYMGYGVRLRAFLDGGKAGWVGLKRLGGEAPY